MYNCTLVKNESGMGTPYALRRKSLLSGMYTELNPDSTSS